MVFDDLEKERFRRLMRRVEAFSGVQVLTYAVLDNHFHLLLRVPTPRPLSDAELLERLTALYGRAMAQNTMLQLARLRRDGQEPLAQQLRQRYVVRMHELSDFVKTLKQRFTQSFNIRHQRKGTLWEERFKSILIQGRQGALTAIAAYIDLNAVRAGIVADPAQYRFCGYGEAVGGSPRARRGLAAVAVALGAGAAWQTVQGTYRRLLYGTGQQSGLTETGSPQRRGFSREEIQAVLDAGGKLSLQQALHCRVRYFTDGLILGSETYVDDAFGRYRDRFGTRSTSGACRAATVALGDLCTARRLRPCAVSLSPC
jgi:REP element-mobilizing transposase RayT